MEKEKNKKIKISKLLRCQPKNGLRALLIAMNYLLLRDFVEHTDSFTSRFLKENNLGSFSILERKKYLGDFLNLYNSIKISGFSEEYPISLCFFTKRIVDGAHRIAIAIFLKEKELSYKTILKPIVKNSTKWFHISGFSKQDIAFLADTFIDFLGCYNK
ncbi:MAG: hypothetical protein J5955_06470 [Bacilli bacterium]|nr:hypothetical protein [Bacilli bacterium]